MAGLMINDTDVIRLAESVNRQQAAGYAPAGGLVIVNGIYFQYMVTGDNGGVAYSTVFTQSDVAFQEEASSQAGNGLGTCQYLNGWFVQAFGAEASGGATSVAWGDVTGKPAVIASGATSAAAWATISGAAVGTQSNQAMAGNKTLANIGGVVPASGLPAASTTAAGIIQIGTAATNAKAGNYVPAWGEVTGKPTTFAPVTATSAVVGGVKQGAAVADAATGTELAQLNALLASLRTAGVIAS